MGAALFSGCAGKAIDESNPKALLDDAEDNIKSDQYQLAIDKLRMLKNKFPYSNYSIDAQLRLADVYFLQESYGEAAASYEAFVDLHPKHERVAYALFKIAKSYFMDIPGPSQRDLTPAYKAEIAYDVYLGRFPNATDVPEAKNDRQIARNKLADKELEIGSFYFRRKQWDAAKARFEKAVSLYPETEAAKTAGYRLARTNERAAREKEAQ